MPQRNRYLKGLNQAFVQLSENPKLGMRCEFIAKGYRKFPQGSHLIFYKYGETFNLPGYLLFLGSFLGLASIFYVAFDRFWILGP